jgi:hypothetical protein
VSRFLTPLRLERIEDSSADGRGTWRLLADLVYESDVAGITITAPEGFITDLASVPRIPVAFMLTGATGHAAAVIHDACYTRHWVTRAMADDIFYEALLVLGVPKWRATLMWAGVRVGGRGPWKARGAEQAIEASAVLTDDPSGA